MLHYFKELKIWKKGKSLAQEFKCQTRSFLEENKYSLISQMVRSIISIPSNISERSSRTTNKELARFRDMAKSSACELETQLILFKNLNIQDFNEFVGYQSKLNELQKMIHGFKSTLDLPRV